MVFAAAAGPAEATIYPHAHILSTNVGIVNNSKRAIQIHELAAKYPQIEGVLLDEMTSVAVIKGLKPAHAGQIAGIVFLTNNMNDSETRQWTAANVRVWYMGEDAVSSHATRIGLMAAPIR